MPSSKGRKRTRAPAIDPPGAPILRGRRGSRRVEVDDQLSGSSSDPAFDLVTYHRTLLAKAALSDNEILFGEFLSAMLAAENRERWVPMSEIAQSIVASFARMGVPFTVEVAVLQAAVVGDAHRAGLLRKNLLVKANDVSVANRYGLYHKAAQQRGSDNTSFRSHYFFAGSNFEAARASDPTSCLRDSVLDPRDSTNENRYQLLRRALASQRKSDATRGETACAATVSPNPASNESHATASTPVPQAGPAVDPFVAPASTASVVAAAAAMMTPLPSSEPSNTPTVAQAATTAFDATSDELQQCRGLHSTHESYHHLVSKGLRRMAAAVRDNETDSSQPSADKVTDDSFVAEVNSLELHRLPAGDCRGLFVLRSKECMKEARADELEDGLCNHCFGRKKHMWKTLWKEKVSISKKSSVAKPTCRLDYLTDDRDWARLTIQQLRADKLQLQIENRQWELQATSRCSGSDVVVTNQRNADNIATVLLAADGAAREALKDDDKASIEWTANAQNALAHKLKHVDRVESFDIQKALFKQFAEKQNGVSKEDQDDNKLIGDDEMKAKHHLVIYATPLRADLKHHHFIIASFNLATITRERLDHILASVENVIELNSLGSSTRTGDGAGENQAQAKHHCDTPA